MYLFNDITQKIANIYNMKMGFIRRDELEIRYLYRVRYKLFKIFYFLPFGMYFPVIKSGDRVLIDFIVKHKNIFSKININLDPCDKQFALYDEILRENGFVTSISKTHILKLSNTYKRTYERYSRSRKNQVNKTINNSQIVVSQSKNDYKQYFKVYLETIKRWGLDKPIYSEEFIASLSNVKNAKLYAMKYKGEIISGIIVFFSENSVFYWQGASLIGKEYNKVYASVKLIDYLIRDMLNDNIYILNLGGSDGLDGVKRFKESFGALEVQYSTYEYRSILFKLLENIMRYFR